MASTTAEQLSDRFNTFLQQPPDPAGIAIQNSLSRLTAVVDFIEEDNELLKRLTDSVEDLIRELGESTEDCLDNKDRISMLEDMLAESDIHVDNLSRSVAACSAELGECRATSAALENEVHGYRGSAAAIDAQVLRLVNAETEALGLKRKLDQMTSPPVANPRKYRRRSSGSDQMHVDADPSAGPSNSAPGASKSVKGTAKPRPKILEVNLENMNSAIGRLQNGATYHDFENAVKHVTSRTNLSEDIKITLERHWTKYLKSLEQQPQTGGLKKTATFMIKKRHQSIRRSQKKSRRSKKKSHSTKRSRVLRR